MRVLQLFRLITGYVKFEAHGVLFERFLNLCREAGIYITEPRRKGEALTGEVKIRDYRRLRRPAKKAGIRLRILEKRGIPFMVHRHRYRLGLAAGLVLFLGTLTVLGNFVWSIRIVGLDTVDEQVVRESLDRLGVKIGRYIPSLDIDTLQQQFLIENENISWVGININSSVAEIRVHEREIGPEILDTATPCDVVALTDGVVRYMEVYRGQPMVKTGETVLKGQLLVSGITEDGKGRTGLTHARAKILASVWEEVTLQVAAEQRYEIDTGESKTFNTLHIFGWNIPLYFSDKTDFAHYQETRHVPLSILGFSLPLSVEQRICIGVEEQVETLSETAAKKRLFDDWERYKKEHYGQAFVEKEQVDIRFENGIYTLTAQVTVKKDIAVEKEILIEKSDYSKE